MNVAYLLLGGNKGDKIKNLRQAIVLITEKLGSISATSKLYETAAWGNTNQPSFLNQALCLQTTLSPTELLKQLLVIEESLGRIRSDQKWMERIIDIDILFYNNEVINTSDLKIPHPYLQDRKFVLIPMLEIAPLLIHPVFNKSIKSLLDECSDTLSVSYFG